MLRWTPRAFREATVWEVAEAYEGYAMSRGIKKASGDELSEDEVRELERWMDEVDGNA